MNKEIPILFSTAMVQALLDGRKTQTRRLIKSRHESGLFQVCTRVTDGQITDINSLDWDERNCEKDISPKWKIGDVLWVREKYCIGVLSDESGDDTNQVYREIMSIDHSVLAPLLSAIEEKLQGLHYYKSSGIKLTK